ncbi:MAG: family 20 glycosylhydrolase, partial [Acidimicrobiales bacterium]
VQDRGVEALAWDEVLDTDVPDGVVVVAWRSSTQGAAAARRGIEVVMAPQSHLYLDWANVDDDAEPVSQHAGLATTWQKVYGFSVVPPGLEPAYHRYVRGAQAELWSEYIATRDHLDYMAYPRLCAFAEVVWGTPGDEAEFATRLTTHLARLGAEGVKFRPLS